MPKQEFNPYEYKGKKQINKSIPGLPGVFRIMIWSERKKKYINKPVGNRYYAKKRVSGRQVTKVFSNQLDAKKWQLDTSLLEESADLKFREVKDRYLEKKKNDAKVATYETSLSKVKHLKFFDDMKMSEITPKVIDEWLRYVKTPEYLKGQHSHRIFYKHELSELRQICVYYAEYICEDTSYALPIKKRHRKDSIINKQKHDEHKARAKKKFLSEREKRAFLNAFESRVEKKPQDEVFRLLAFFQMNTGTRIGEAAAVHWEDLCLNTGMVAIQNTVTWSRKKGRETFISKTTKTGVNRTIPLKSEVVNALKQWCLKIGRAKGLVFSFDGESPLPYRSIVHRYDAVLESIGSKWRGTHLARHSFATDFLEKTGNHRALQGILGHQTSRQTDHYAKMTGVTLMDGMRQYEEAELKIARQS